MFQQLQKILMSVILQACSDVVEIEFNFQMELNYFILDEGGDDAIESLT